jgi:ectoine hydroxylase-related dioxygenase (phytanoyl-CoA dioxygenase family)
MDMSEATLPRVLTARQVETFHEEGYLLLPDVFSPAEVAEMRQAFDRLEALADTLGQSGLYRGSQFVIEPGPGGRPAIHRIVWCGAAEPALLAYGADRRLLRPAAELLGSERMNQLIGQAHFKRPGDGVEFPWHQDSIHRRYGTPEWRDVNGKGSYVQTVTALDDVDDDNGPLLMIPGSAALGHLSWLETQPLPVEWEARAIPALMRAGSVLLFGPYLIHSSRSNGSGRPRRTFINGFASPGANSRVYPGEGSGRLLSL